MAPDHSKEAEAGKIICSTSPSTKPLFVKTLKHRRNLLTLEIPATFVKEHGHNCKPTVTLQGPSGRPTIVHLTIRTYPVQDRVHFGGTGWRAFAIDNGLKVGDYLVFSLIPKSTFMVRLFSGAANHMEIQESHVGRIKSSKSEANLGAISHERPSKKLVGVQGRKKVINKASHVPCQMQNDVVYSRNTPKKKPYIDILVDHELQCPRFVTTIKKSNLKNTLTVPQEFFDKYGTYFSETTNIFQGATGRWVELRFTSTQNLRFTSGWEAFRNENDIKLGDVLLVALHAPGCWLVQVVANRLEELRIGHQSDSSKQLKLLQY